MSTPEQLGFAYSPVNLVVVVSALAVGVFNVGLCCSFPGVYLVISFGVALAARERDLGREVLC